MKTAAWLKWASLLFACSVFLLPLLLMLAVSLTSAARSATDAPTWQSLSFSVASWASAWGSACVGAECGGLRGWFTRSLLMVLPAVILSLAIGAAAANELRLCRPLTQRIVQGLLFVGLFTPPQVTLYPMIMLLRSLDLFGTTTGLVLTHVIWGLPFTTLCFRSYFNALPAELFHMARLDGANSTLLLRRVILPMSLPVAVSTGILQFTFVWNDLLLGLTFGSRDAPPISAALHVLAGSQHGRGDTGVTMAAAMLISLPTLLLYALFGRRLSGTMTSMVTKGRTA